MFLYSPLNGDTWYFISWDNDGSFTDTKRLMQEDKSGGLEKGVSNYWGNVLFQRILKSDSLRAELGKKIEEYRAAITEDKIKSMIDVYAPVVEAYAFRAPDAEHMPLTYELYQKQLSLLPSEIERSYEG